MSALAVPRTGASARRELTLRAALGIGARALRAWYVAARERSRRRRAAAQFRADLDHLDDHMLRDLGFDRSEVASVAAELAGDAPSTRMRAYLQSPP